jgi:hypothetical protein
MSKTILIPTDFSVGSLSALKHTLAETGPDGVNVVLMHARLLSTSITDLLFHSPHKALAEQLRPEFNDALAILRNRFEGRVHGVKLALFHGRTVSAFRQFAQSHSVDEVHVPRGHALRLEGAAFDPMPLIRRSGLPVVEVVAAAPEMVHEVDHLQLLFAR